VNLTFFVPNSLLVVLMWFSSKAGRIFLASPKQQGRFSCLQKPVFNVKSSEKLVSLLLFICLQDIVNGSSIIFYPRGKTIYFSLHFQGRHQFLKNFANVYQIFFLRLIPPCFVLEKNSVAKNLFSLKL